MYYVKLSSDGYTNTIEGRRGGKNVLFCNFLNTITIWMCVAFKFYMDQKVKVCKQK